MRIRSIILKDFLAHQRTEIDFGGLPLVLLVGPDAAGKSSIIDSIRWGLLNRARGCEARDNRRLVRRGAETGKVEIGATHGAAELFVTRTPSTSSPTQADIRRALGLPDDSAIEAALDAGHFLQLSPRERKALVFRLGGAEVSEALLAKHGITDPEVVKAALTKGFEAAEKVAAEKKRAANRTRDEIHPVAPNDDGFKVGEEVRRLSQVTAVQAEAALTTIRRLREAAMADVTAAETRAAQAARTAAARGPAGEAVTAAKRTLASVEERVAKAAAERLDVAALRAQAASLVPAITEPMPEAEAPARLAPGPDLSLPRANAARLSERLAAARVGPWARIVTLADEIDLATRWYDDEKDPGNPVAVLPVKAQTDQLREIATTLGAATPAMVAESEAADRALADAEAAQARVEAENAAALKDAAARRQAWEKRVAERNARVNVATRDRTTLLERITVIEGNVRQDESALASARAALTAAESRLAGIESAATTTTDDLPALREKVAALDVRVQTGEAIVTKVRAFHQQAAQHMADVARREELAKEASRFEAMEHALRPAGVMSSLVAKPLTALRTALDAISERILPCALRLTDEWDVLYDDAPASLASTSERWRIGAALAIAVGAVSGLRWCALDEASVLHGLNRDALFSTLLAARAFFDQVFVVASRSEAEMATLAPPPGKLADVVGIWRVEAGQVSRVVTANAEALA